MNVKTATKGYPKAQIMPHVAEIKGNAEAQRQERRERRGKAVAYEKQFAVGSKQVTLTAAGHNKKVPLLLIASASSMIPGTPHVKTWTTRNAAGELVKHEIRTEQPEMHELYRTYMNPVDLHNKLRQGERSMSDAWRTQSWEYRHFGEALGFIEVNIFKSLKFFKKGIWLKMNHTEFRRRLAHALMTLGKEGFPDDMGASHASAGSFTSPTAASSARSDLHSLDSAGAMFCGPGIEHVFVSFDAQKRELHTCAYCNGNRTQKYCLTCFDLGRGKIPVCGRKSKRTCIDDHAAGKPIKHGSYNYLVHAQAEKDGDPGPSVQRSKRGRPRTRAARVEESGSDSDAK